MWICYGGKLRAGELLKRTDSEDYLIHDHIAKATPNRVIFTAV